MNHPNFELQTRATAFYREFPLTIKTKEIAVEKNSFADESENENILSENSLANEKEMDLPILATANDLREAVRFFKYKPHGVSIVEIMNAEPRRVFDARKVAAYQFWGVIERDEERLQLTALGEELAKNTEAECEINRRILHSIPAYAAAVEWIYRQKIEIATYYDVADFWEHMPNAMRLSDDNKNNIEAVIVSFFSLCHAAELGTATVGKRGQPARLNINFKQINHFLKYPFETNRNKVLPVIKQVNYASNKHQANLDCVYISGEKFGAAIENLSAALRLADFTFIANSDRPASYEFVPTAQLDLMNQCQAAIFLLDEKDFVGKKDEFHLSCQKIAEISVAQALYNQRVIVLWQGSETPPDSIQKSGVNLFVGETLDWEMNVKLVMCLKNLNS